jgi:hypothetical protein
MWLFKTCIFLMILSILSIYILKYSGYDNLSLLNYIWKRKSDKIFYNTDLEWCNVLRNNYKILRN